MDIVLGCKALKSLVAWVPNLLESNDIIGRNMFQECSGSFRGEWTRSWAEGGGNPRKAVQVVAQKFEGVFRHLSCSLQKSKAPLWWYKGIGARPVQVVV